MYYNRNIIKSIGEKTNYPPEGPFVTEMEC